MTDSSTATERVGRYQLLEPIGGGPNGNVSRAKVFGVAGFERQFAVKRFLPELTVMSAHASALSTAARSYGGLEHPRIARMSEFGVAQGQTFTAVELVVGLDTMRLIAEAKLDGVGIAIGGALALISQAARAVGYAHGRGLSHLGLAPSNVIVTGDGDVKVTDFGILAATLTTRPADLPRLHQRIGYLAPEQIAGEASSAATDVFALGVIAYELVTGLRAYSGENSHQIADAILAGPPPEPPLPRPIVRVLQRCVARSPFERFPDARAFADALDAALRVAPVPGTRKDIGAQVKSTLERHAAMNEGNMSGVVALNLGSGPIAMSDSPPVQTRSLGRESYEAIDVSTSEFVRPDTPVAGPAPLVGPSAASTMPDLPRPMTTVTGLAPPPIPVPPGMAAPSSPPLPQIGPPNTIPGMAAARRPVPAIPSLIPQIKPRLPRPPSVPPVVPSLVRPPSSPPDTFVDQRAATRVPDDPSVDDQTEPVVLEVEESDADRDLTIPGSGSMGPPTPRLKPRDIATSEMESFVVDRLNQAARKPTNEIAATAEEILEEPRIESARPPPPLPPPVLTPSPSSTVPGMIAPLHLPPPQPPQIAQPYFQTISVRTPRKSRAPLVIIGVLALVVVGLGAYFVGWTMQEGKADEVASGSGSAKPTHTRDASVAIAQSPDASVAIAHAPDANVAVALLPIDAAAATSSVPGDAAAKPAVVQPTAASDSLQITSTPAGARVFIDGADQGLTPVKLPGSTDRHTIALLLAAHELYVAEVDGHGAFSIPLNAVTPSGGPAGIKVIKCKDKERYYVTVDGKPTGQTCPTERIECTVGAHTVEVYDIVTETRRTFDINVVDTRLSYRVRIE